MSEPVDPIAARYGRKKPNKKLIIGFAGVALSIFVFWAIWAAFFGSLPQGKTISYEVWNDQTTVVDFSVTKPKDRSAVCYVKALSEDYGVVAFKEVRFPAGESYIVSTVALTTVRKAVTGLVDSCWFD